MAGLLALATAALLAVAAPADAGVLGVTDTTDAADAAPGDNSCDSDIVTSGSQCSLRAAIEESNALAGPDRIKFVIPGTGRHTIVPLTELPSLTSPVLINGYSQRGARPNSLGLARGDNARIRITLSGRNLSGFGVDGLTVDAGGSGSTIRGMAVNRFPSAGISLDGEATVVGNFIGTDASGRRPRGNGSDGIFVLGGSGTVGGRRPADRNVISDNGDSGITSNGDLVVKGNYVGTTRDGKSPLGNHVAFREDAAITLGQSGVIGGNSNAANVIAFNDGGGIATLNSGVVSIRGNRIYSNLDGLAIDLNEDGRTANDPGDADGGSNGRQNFPVLGRARLNGRVTSVGGRLATTPSEGFRIEFFAGSRNSGPAERFLGVARVTTNAAGRARIARTFRGLRRGDRVVATAIANDDGATSELSDPVQVRRR